MTEAELQATVLEAARWMRWVDYHTFDSRRSQPGFPDLVLLRKGVCIVAELKSEQGRVTPEQSFWLSEWALVPGIRVKLWRPSNLDDALAELKDPKAVNRCTWSTSSTPT